MFSLFSVLGCRQPFQFPCIVMLNAELLLPADSLLSCSDTKPFAWIIPSSWLQKQEVLANHQRPLTGLYGHSSSSLNIWIRYSSCWSRNITFREGSIISYGNTSLSKLSLDAKLDLYNPSFTNEKKKVLANHNQKKKNVLLRNGKQNNVWNTTGIDEHHIDNQFECHSLFSVWCWTTLVFHYHFSK